MLFAGLIATVLSVGCSSSTTTESSSNEVELEDIANQGLTEEEVGSVKIGILHSLSGTMAISESSLVDAVQLAVDEINAAGGVLGKTIEPVVVDPASDWDLFAEKAKELIVTEQVAVTFGCWTSVSRKSVLPVFEDENALLFYPVQYEGEEQSLNVFYTAAT
ncbi:MAG: transporter substrate-binding protein, partial [Planctomycetaceae bacterium]|nr:transporter substrate-binding protein [Planctomycetaceae bacterium]